MLVMSCWVLGVATPVVIALGVFLAFVASPLLGHPFVLCCGFLALLSLGFLLAPRLRRTMTVGAFLCYSLYVTLSWADAQGQLSLGLPQVEVVALTGILEDDSSLTRSGGQVLRVRLVDCSGRWGQTASAKGLVSVMIIQDTTLPYGTTLNVRGSFKDPAFFVAKQTQVLRIPRFGEKRHTLMRRVGLALSRRVPEPRSRSLAGMLLLGQSDSASFPLKDLALKSGCSHILALSGMHLGFVIALGSALLGRIFGYRIGRIAGLSLAAGFLVVVGPKPSLMRAALLSGSLAVIGKRKFAVVYGWWASLVLQAWLFPCSVKTLGFVLSHQAFGALVAARFLAPLFHPFLAPIFRGMMAVAFTAPVTLVVMGNANLLSVVLTDPTSLLIKLILYLSLFSLTPLPGVPWVLQQATNLLVRMLSWGVVVGGAIDWNGYGVFLGVLLTCFPLLGYAKLIVEKVRKQRYDLELQLRFPWGDQAALGSPGSGDVQEVRAEFPHFGVHSKKNRRRARHWGRNEGVGSRPGHRVADQGTA